MDEAVKLAVENVLEGGKPFGAIIVKDGKIIGSGTNDSVSDNDPTAHAEIQAIRLAAQKWGEKELLGASMYASGHPCPMCLAAMHLTGFVKIYYASELDEVAETPLDVKPVYKEMRRPLNEQNIPLFRMQSSLPEDPVQMWLKKQKG